MLLEESVWIRDTFKKYFTPDHFPILNIGSSTVHFRMKVQPHIHQNVFLPLLENNSKVIHLDIKMDGGVDLVGDLNEPEFRKKLGALGIKSVLCSNLLEHLADPQMICNSILEILKPGNLIVITVPYAFPFHKDPIDTMLRPDVKALHAFFPGTTLRDASIIVSARSYSQDLLANKKYLMVMIARLCLPFYRPSEWPKIVKDFLGAGKKYSATCILLEKK